MPSCGGGPVLAGLPCWLGHRLELLPIGHIAFAARQMLTKASTLPRAGNRRTPWSRVWGSTCPCRRRKAVPGRGKKCDVCLPEEVQEVLDHVEQPHLDAQVRFLSRNSTRTRCVCVIADSVPTVPTTTFLVTGLICQAGPVLTSVTRILTKPSPRTTIWRFRVRQVRWSARLSRSHPEGLSDVPTCASAPRANGRPPAPATPTRHRCGANRPARL